MKYIEEWYQKSMDLLYQYQVTNTKLEEAVAKANIVFREGAKQFLQKMIVENIPVIILSAGIGNVIESFLKSQNCYGKNLYIISNFITFQNDKMQKFKAKIIHSMNKTLEGKLPKTRAR